MPKQQQNLSDMDSDDLIVLNQKLGAEADAIRVQRKDIADELRKRSAKVTVPAAQVTAPGTTITARTR